jgi:glycerol uptake facilitator-like aquaporin
LIASGRAGFSLADGFASNGYETHSPGAYSMVAAFVVEVVMTFFFLVVILGSTMARRRRVCSYRHRPLPDAYPPDQHSGNEHIGQPGSFNRARQFLLLPVAGAGRSASFGFSGSLRSWVHCLPDFYILG